MLSSASISYLITDLEIFNAFSKNSLWKFSNEPESDFYRNIDTASIWMVSIVNCG